MKRSARANSFQDCILDSITASLVGAGCYVTYAPGALCVAERAALTFDTACTTLIPEQIAPVKRHSLSGLLQCSAS